MSLSLLNLDGHLNRIMQDIPVSLIIKGVQYDNAAVRNSQPIIQTIEVGGVLQEIDYDIFIRQSQFPEAPKIGTLIRVQERLGKWSIMKIVSIKPSPDAGNLLTLGMQYAKLGGEVPT
jgi:hypothetical protein